MGERDGMLQAVGDGFDPWKLNGARATGERSSENYDPAEFYVRSVNKNDHSESIRLRAPMDVLAEMSAIVASGRYPMYRTMSDLFRDALVHRLHWLADEYSDEDLAEWVRIEEMQSRLEAMEREADRLQDLVEKWRVRVTRAKAARDVWAIEQAKRFIAEDIPRCREPYRGQLVRVLAELDN